MSSYNSTSLNARQIEAVQATEGPVMVIAGAGSGKTLVLTERISYLIGESKVSPHNILAFTFTNKAAQEMKERLEKKIPLEAKSLWIGTFHKTGVKILRMDGDGIGLPRDFSIYDSTDSLNLIRSIMSRLSLEGSVLRSSTSIREKISSWKRELLDPELARERAVNNIDNRIAQIYAEYEKELRKARALDFDDLICKVVHLFSACPDKKEKHAKRFRYVLVDEFQDTNPIQMMMIEDLSSYWGNLFVVGDDDQSIYGWRGARVEHMLNFESLYPGTRVIKLEQNYRSSRTILEAANNVIKCNRGRKGKDLWTSGEDGQKIDLLESMDEEAEAMNVLDYVSRLEGSGFQLGQIAGLYRTNAQSRAFEEAFLRANIPYQIVGTVGYYERMEVRDILAYCKLLVNHSDSVSLKRIINVPRRAIGKATVENLEKQALAKGTTIMDLLLKREHEVGKAQGKRCESFVEIYIHLSKDAGEKKAPQVIEAIIERTRYRDYLKDNFPDSDSRIENIEELISAAGSFADANENGSLRAFLEEIALVSDIDGYDEGKGTVTLMTLHNAKGLEFDCVIVAGLEEGLLPHINSMERESELEEERRLFYVGMTRAKKRLCLSHASMRRRMGSITGQAPSRFLFEVPLHLLEDGIAGFDLAQSAFPDFGEEHLARRSKSFSDSFEDRHPDYENLSQEHNSFEVGMKIKHKNFGRGIIRKIEGKGENLRITVIFDGGGERKFMARYAPIRPV